jgi:hypothetical protein
MTRDDINKTNLMCAAQKLKDYAKENGDEVVAAASLEEIAESLLQVIPVLGMKIKDETVQ